jgi:hypothetical protein
MRFWLVALCAMLLVPLFLCDVPPLGDYANHLARVWVLSRISREAGLGESGLGDPVLAGMFATHWAVIPNLGLDLVMPPLVRWIGVYPAGKVAIAAGVLLPVLGCVAYQRALGGRSWGLGAGILAYSGSLLLGFLNFQISIGLALLLASLWLLWRERRPWPTVAMAMIGAVALFACHLMGLVFFGLLIWATELARLVPFRLGPPRPRASWLREAVCRGAVLALVFALPAGLYAVSNLADLGGDGAWWGPWGKLRQLRTPFIAYNGWLDTLAGVATYGIPLLAVLLRRGRFPPPAAWAVALLVLVYLPAPYAWKGTFQLDTRLTVMLAFMMFAGFVPARRGRVERICVSTAVGGLLLARMAILGLGWHAQAAVLADLRQAMAPLRPGETVMVADASPEEAPAYWKDDPHWQRLSDGITLGANLGALVLIEHRAWWPFEFDNLSQQPIRTLQPYRSLALRAVSLADRTRLLTMDLCGFDAVLLTDAEAVPPLPADRFRRLAGTGFAQLYAVTVCKPD